MLKLDVILYNQSEFIEFDANWVNKTKNHILQIGFNLKEKITKTLNEDLFGTVERTFDPDYDIYKEIPAPRGVELKPNTSPMQRFMSTQNFALFTKGNSEYEINKNTLYLTLLRATGIISNPKNSTRGTPAGPPLETPNLQQLGKNWAKFAIAFEKNEQELFRLSEEYYGAYIPVFTNKPDTKFIDVDGLVYSAKIENNSLRLRTYLKDIKTIDYKAFSR